jgi:hypothetical protein
MFAFYAGPSLSLSSLFVCVSRPCSRTLYHCYASLCPLSTADPSSANVIFATSLARFDFYMFSLCLSPLLVANSSLLILYSPVRTSLTYFQRIYLRIGRSDQRSAHTRTILFLLSLSLSLSLGVFKTDINQLNLLAESLPPQASIYLDYINIQTAVIIGIYLCRPHELLYPFSHFKCFVFQDYTYSYMYQYRNRVRCMVCTA